VTDTPVEPCHDPVVVIVGGGASGTLTATHLLRTLAETKVRARLVLIDRYGRHGTGQAYSTTNPAHLLNSVAASMSALADDPGHLLRWCHRYGSAATPGTLLPRRVYGRYLRATLADAERDARGTASVARLTRAVEAITRPGLRRALRVHLGHGGRLDADAVVLATGNLTPATGPWSGAADRHVADPWAPGALARIGDGDVLVIGTGLTMLDVATTLTGDDPDTVVYALSRHGLLPARHRRPRTPGATSAALDETLKNGALGTGDPIWLSELMRAVRSAVTAEAGDWPAVIESLRPRIPDLWARLPLGERRRFLTRVARYWEIHRHQAPAATADRIAALRESGRLRVIRGRLLSTERCPDGLRALVECGGDRRELRAGWLVSATGPGADITTTTDPLMSALLEGGLARPDPLRLGIDADGDGRVLDAGGRSRAPLFTLGPPLRGVRYETTAIPEIRAQAASLARRLAAVIGDVPVPTRT
jgi:uncharacterized NAD(P)/FAD-binding protein YdhS